MQLSQVRCVPVILLAGGCWLWMAIGVIHLGMKWQSVGFVRHNVEVVLPNDRTLAGDLSIDWEGTYNLTDADGKSTKFKGFKIMSIPPTSMVPSPFSYRMVLPFILYCLGSLVACYCLWLKGMRPRDKISR